MLTHYTFGIISCVGYLISNKLNLFVTAASDQLDCCSEETIPICSVFYMEYVVQSYFVSVGLAYLF